MEDIITDEMLNREHAHIYYNRARDHGRWVRLLKFPIAKGDFSDYSEQGLNLNIHHNREIVVQEKEREYKLSLSGNKQKILFDLLRNPDSSGKYKISVYRPSRDAIYLRIYISQEYINRICDSYQIAPRLIETIIRESGSHSQLINYTISDIQPIQNIAQDLEKWPFTRQITITPFTHQLNNLEWMDTVEHNVDMGIHYHEYAINSDLLKFDNAKMILYLDTDTNIVYNENSLWRYGDRYKREQFRGAVLCDEVGSGKTLSMCCLIMANKPHRSRTTLKHKHDKNTPKLKLKPATTPTLKPNIKPKLKLKIKATCKIDNSNTREVGSEVANETASEVGSQATKATDISLIPSHQINQANIIPEGLTRSNATLLYCPPRLVGQWIDEIAKYTHSGTLKVLQLSTIVHIKKYSPTDLINADLIIVSLNLLENKAYREQDKLKLTDYYWHRVIVDEAHEVLLHEVKRAKNQRINNAIFSTKGRYKWVCTGTPLPEGRESMDGIISFLTNKDMGKMSVLLDNISKTGYQNLLTRFFRRNTIAGKDEILIPQVNESTDLLSFTKTEQQIYNDAKRINDQYRMIQLCTNILVSDQSSSILGNKALSLDQVNSVMIEHYHQQVDQLKQDINTAEERCKQLKENLETESQLIKQQITDLKDQAKIVTSKAEKQEIKEEIGEHDEALTKLKNSTRGKLKTQTDNIERYKTELKWAKKQVAVFTSLNVDKIINQVCMITGKSLSTNKIAITPSGDCYSIDGIELLFNGSNGKFIYDPRTREEITHADLVVIDPIAINKKDTIDPIRNQWGTKMAHMIKSLRKVFTENSRHRVIIFSQWHKMLQMISSVLDESNIEHVFCRGNIHMMSKSIRRFKRDKNCRVILLSSESCSSGSNLTEASHIYLLDTANADVEAARAIEDQAIARAVRVGQKFNVQVKRFIMKDTIEEEFYNRNKK